MKRLVVRLWDRLRADLAVRPLESLASLRIGVAIVLLLKIATEWGIGLDLYGDHGFMPWNLTNLAINPYSPRIEWLAKAVAPFGLSSDQAVTLTLTLLGIFTITLGFGLLTRLSAILVWFIHLMVMNSGGLSIYGVDMFANIALFYCCVMPVGKKWSLDAQFFRYREPDPVILSIWLFLLRFHLCIVYIVGGIAKSRGSDWWNGESMWQVMSQPQFHSIDIISLASVPWLAKILTISVLALETGYPLFMTMPKTRPYWFAATISMHIGIAAFMHLWLFGLIMIVLNIAAYGACLESFLLAFARRFRPLQTLNGGRA